MTLLKKTVYDKLVAKVNNLDTNSFVLKTKYRTDNSELEKKITDTSGLLKEADCNAKITEIEDKIPSISALATNAAITAVENKIPNINSLVKKLDYNTKIGELEKKLTDHNHDKCNSDNHNHDHKITPNTLSADVFNARLAQTKLITKTEILMPNCQVLTEKLHQIS